MKSKVILMVLALIGCSKTRNPTVFSKINPPAVEQPKIQPAAQPRHQATLLELYLSGYIGTDYMLNWFFKDYKQYRYKLYYITKEVESMQPLSIHDRDKILVLQYFMNEVIQKFNERNLLYRADSIIKAAIESRKRNLDEPQESLSDIKNKGATAKHISDNPMGYLGSFGRYGFKIETVRLIKDQNIETE